LSLGLGNMVNVVWTDLGRCQYLRPRFSY